MSVALPKPYNIRQGGQKEKTVQAGILRLLKAHRIWCARLESSGCVRATSKGLILTPTRKKGLPDIIACFEGQLIAIECKAFGGRLSDDQYSTLLEIIKCGGKSIVATSTLGFFNYFFEKNKGLKRLEPSQLDGIIIV